MIKSIEVYQDRELTNLIEYGDDITEPAYIKVIYSDEMENEIKKELDKDYNVSDLKLIETTDSYSVYEVNSLKYDDGTEDYVNIKDYGAVGDGKTDDYQAIMDAIDYAAENDKDGVYFPSGEFGITNNIWLNSKYNGLTFSSVDGVLKVLDTDGVSRVIEIKADGSGDVEDITIKGLEIDGNKDNIGAKHGDTMGILSWGDVSVARRIEIYDVVTHDLSQTGISVQSDDSVVKDCKSHDNWRHGFSTRNSKNVTFENIYSYNNVSPDNDIYGSGVNVHGSQDVILKNFKCNNNGYGMKTSIGRPSLNIINGVLKNNNGVGYRTTGDSPNEVKIKGLEIIGNGGAGMELRYEGGKYLIEDLKIIDNGKNENLNQTGALYITDECDELQINNLTIEKYPGVGFNTYTRNFRINNITIKETGSSIRIR